jgi:DNA-binding XRE family transcriptional regulator
MQGVEQHARVKKLKEIYSKRFRAKHRHGIGRPAGNLYYSVRMLLGLNQTKAGALLGISRQAWRYRERYKVMYWPLEIAMLQELSGLSNEEFIQLLNDIA